MRPIYRKVIDEIKLRQLLNPLRYHKDSSPVFVRALDFDNLKAEYEGLRAEVEQVANALANFGGLYALQIIKENTDATSQGEEQGSSIEEHLNGDEGRETAEASHRDSGVGSGEWPTEEVTPVQASTGSITYRWDSDLSQMVPKEYNVRADDFLVGDVTVTAHTESAVKVLGNFKWDPSFEQSKLQVANLDDEPAEERYGYSPKGYKFSSEDVHPAPCCE